MPPARLPQILARVKAVIDTVLASSSSRCHLGQRRFPSPEFLLSCGQDPAVSYSRFHIWFVQRGTTEEKPHDTLGNLRDHTILIDAYYQALDPTQLPNASTIGTTMTSEQDFSALVEHVCDHLRNDKLLHGGGTAVMSTPPVVTSWDLRPLDVTPEGASEPELVECHHATIQFVATEHVGIVYV